MSRLRCNKAVSVVARCVPPGDTGSVVDPQVRRVLIYRLGSLGDMLVALPALKLVARAFPAAVRLLLTNQPVHAKAPAAEAVLQSMGLVDGYISYPVGTRNPLQLVGLWWQIRSFRPEVVVYLAAARGVRSARRDLRFFRLCGVDRVIGVPLTGALQENFYGLLPGSPEARTVLQGAELEPEAARLARTVQELGDARLDQPESWALGLTAAEHDRATSSLAPANGLRGLLAVSVGTKVQAKDWGKERWRALLEALAPDLPGYGLVLLGAHDETEVSTFVSEVWTARGGGKVLNLCGKLTPRESAAVIARCRVFLGHDSGPMHLAAAVNVPVCAIFAARNIPRQWFPVGARHEVVYHPVECWGCGLETCIEQRKKCLTSISVEEVHARVRMLLERTREAPTGTAAVSPKVRDLR